ncbi:MAG: hypothetical protein VXW00_10855, partial [Candidatus Latescibacterota bacterium]|nr:hypothetical protein [Candidatus Latescibacterota bacterium]
MSRAHNALCSLYEEARAMATIIDGKTRIPFMRGMLVHHLIQRGVEHGEARDIANAVRNLLGKQ